MFIIDFYRKTSIILSHFLDLHIQKSVKWTVFAPMDQSFHFRLHGLPLPRNVDINTIISFYKLRTITCLPFLAFARALESSYYSKSFIIDRLNEKDVRSGLLKLDLKRGSLLCFSGRFLSSNVYLMVVDNRAVAVDCGMPWTANRVLYYLNKNRLKLEYIFLTHSHFDHVMGASKLKKNMEIKVVAHTRSKRGDMKVKDGDVIRVIDNELSFLVFYTGVHKVDHVWYYESSNRVLFIGDHLPTSTDLKILREKHGAKPKIILPGHGKPAFL
jgi:hypothetical protein